jgi:hypothetical protein
MGMKRSLITLAFSASLPWLSASALAQDPAKPPPGYEKFEADPTQQTDANPLVVGAYAAFFVGMFGFVVYVARQQSAMAKEMAELAERIKRAEKK